MDKIYTFQIRIRGKNINEIGYTLENLCIEISVDEDVISYNIM